MQNWLVSFPFDVDASLSFESRSSSHLEPITHGHWKHQTRWSYSPSGFWALGFFSVPVLSLSCEVAPLTVSPAPLVVSLTVLVKPLVVSPTVLPTPPTADNVSRLVPALVGKQCCDIPAPPTVSVTPPTVLPRVSVTPPRSPCQPNQLVRTRSRASRMDSLPPALSAIAA